MASPTPRIAFLVLFELTEIYLQIAKELAAEAECFFIASASDTYQRLMDAGIDRDLCLDLSATRRSVRRMGPATAEVRQKIEQYEKYGPSFSSIMMMSRFYAGEPAEPLLHYMGTSAVRMEEFLLAHRIEWLVTEPTNAIEVMAASVCAKNGIHFAHFGFTRLPAGRLLFLNDIEEREYFPVDVPKVDRRTVHAWLEGFKVAPDRPVYFAKQAAPRSLLDLAKSAIARVAYLAHELVGDVDVNYNTFAIVLDMYTRRYRRWFAGGAGLNESQLAAPYVIYFLQVHPERSVDVLSPHWSDQFEVIRHLRRSLPSGVNLYVKDHPSSYGAQKPGFYERLRRLPGVQVVSKSVDSRLALRGALFSATVSGTVAFESALLGVPALIMSKVFFRRLPLMMSCDSPLEVSERVRQLPLLKHSQEATLDFLHHLWNNSVPTQWEGDAGKQQPAVIASFVDLLRSAIQHQRQHKIQAEGIDVPEARLS